ncbi:hypothetical protein IG631_10822 [Alternaria alternata]|nr:hypothetical protein IG631_10822 [Alternaria alternata]
MQLVQLAAATWAATAIILGGTLSSGKHGIECLDLSRNCAVCVKALRSMASLYISSTLASNSIASHSLTTHVKRLVHFCQCVIRWSSTPEDAIPVSELRVRNAHPREWACIRNRA